VTRQRIDFISEHVANSDHSDARLPAIQYKWFDVMQAKLTAFLEPPAKALTAYPESDKSLPARYARAIAYYRIPKLDKALPIIDGLIADYPKNPYFHELKGQMLFENGRVAQAVTPYREAVRLAPNSPLLRTQMAQVLLESGDPKLNSIALSNLKESARRDTNNGLTWHLLSVAHGRAGDIGMAALSIAEKALLEGDRKTSMDQARRAMHLLRQGSLEWLRAETVMNEADELPSG
jgi:predicted Zn-dependent protease